jgi:hypothetical protein
MNLTVEELEYMKLVFSLIDTNDARENKLAERIYDRVCKELGERKAKQF